MAEPRMSPAEMRRAFFLTFPGVAPAIILSAIDQTIVATALPAIAGSLGAVEHLSWVVVAYLIAATIAAPVFGRLGDVFGRRRLLLVALGLAALGAALSAAAPSFGVLILGRLIQGFAGGGMATLAMALIGEAVPPRERGRFQAYIVASFTTASCLGPITGGFMTEHFGWRAVFWVLLPWIAVAVPLALRIPARPEGLSAPARPASASTCRGCCSSPASSPRR
ncbi:MFS transporter [Paeniroseomonas aquatica]|uniref:MFS transporter n=1 Tax=Paeniroseomonas aquatica TaxID=373043 RepID=UPI0036100ABF